MTAELNHRGFDGSENFVATLMKARGIRGRVAKRFVRTTDSRHDLPVAANVLDRDVTPSGPNVAWAADITYLPTAEGWRYLAVVEDLFRRRIVGWSMDATRTSRPWMRCTWRWGVVIRRRGCWRTRIAAASTPAGTTEACGRSTASRAA